MAITRGGARAGGTGVLRFPPRAGSHLTYEGKGLRNAILPLLNRAMKRENSV